MKIITVKFIKNALNKKVKNYNIKLEENIEFIKQNEELKNKNSRKNQLEVQDLEFKSIEPITNSIMFNGRLFVIDRYQSKVNSDIINYRCKNHRKI